MISSFCSGADCVDVERVSSFCSGAECVGVTPSDDGVIVRDTKQRGQLGRSELRFTDEEWAAFVAGVKAGEFDFDVERVA